MGECAESIGSALLLKGTNEEKLCSGTDKS
jgi:hypothetical protein